MHLLHPLVFAVLIVVSCLGSSAEASASNQRPNILLFFVDDWGRYASIYADPSAPSANDVVRTPHFDRIGREGVVFQNAFVPVSSCSPCRASLATGRHFWNCGSLAFLNGKASDWKGHKNPFPGMTKFPDLLREGGYVARRSGKTISFTESKPSSAEKGIEAAEYLRYGMHVSTAGTAEERQRRHEEVMRHPRQEMRRMLAAREAGKPFFFIYGTINVHRPFIAGSGEALWGIEPDRLRGRLPKFLPDVEEVRRDFADYLGEVQAADAMLGVLLAELEAAGELDRTLVILTGDNGIPGIPRGKTNCYDLSTQAPLLMRWPSGIPGGRRVEDFISLMDIGPTLLEMAGVRVPPDMDGRSFLRQLASRQTGWIDASRDQVIVGRELHYPTAREGNLPYPMRAIRTKDYLYIKNFKPDRWPNGAPYNVSDLAMAADYDRHEEAPYRDLDASLTKSWLLAHRSEAEAGKLVALTLGMRPAEELYDVVSDPDSLRNLAADPAHAQAKRDLECRLFAVLEKSGDPRLTDAFDKPPYVAQPKAGRPETATAAVALQAEALTAPVPIAPIHGAALTTGVPHFRWESIVEPRPEAMPSYAIQISTDRGFMRVVDEDRLAAVIRWYLPDRELPPGEYWWRIAAVDARGTPGNWSEPRSFSIRQPEHVVTIPRGATLADIHKALDAAAARTPAIVRFEPGSYRLDPGELRHFIRLKDVSDLTIDGGGSSIVLTHPVGWFDLRNCRRILVKNLTMDFDPPSYTAARVVATDSASGTLDAEFLPGHSLPEPNSVFAREPRAMVVTEAEDFAMKRGIALVTAFEKFEKISDRRYRYTLEKPTVVRKSAIERKPGPERALSTGDILIFDPRWYAEGGGHGSFVGGGEDVVYLNLTIRGAANECFGSFYADRHAMLHVRLERGPGRALSVNNGGHNHHNARTGPWVEGCFFENTGDDTCHINGYLMTVERQPAPDLLVINLRQPYDIFGAEAKLDIRSGDRLVLYHTNQGRLLTEAKVLSCRIVGKTIEVRLDRPVSGIATGTVKRATGAKHAAVSSDSRATEVYNASRMCNQFVFRHNFARNGRRVGVIAKGDGGLIEDNRFENMGGGGVELWPAPFEGLAAENYVIRRNTIVDCGRLSRVHAGIWATMFKPGGDRLHRKILIAENRITGFAGSSILLGDMRDAVVRDNQIVLGPMRAPAVKRPESIVLRNTEEVRLENNTIVEAAP